jgi:hypothetical protein
MSTLTVSRGEGNDPGEDFEAKLGHHIEELVAKAAAAPAERLAGPQGWWDVVALGPYQAPALAPHRVLEVGQAATIWSVVWLNPNFPPGPQNACTLITGFGGKIEISYTTSRTDTMEPVPALSGRVCIPTVPGQCLYWVPWTFTPQESACLYMTNVCVRICNCSNTYVREFSGFARWIANPDADLIFGAPAWQFDVPIRYMVSDIRDKCC